VCVGCGTCVGGTGGFVAGVVVAIKTGGILVDVMGGAGIGTGLAIFLTICLDMVGVGLTTQVGAALGTCAAGCLLCGGAGCCLMCDSCAERGEKVKYSKLN
jgi:hypothetical protein